MKQLLITAIIIGILVMSAQAMGPGRMKDAGDKVYERMNQELVPIEQRILSRYQIDIDEVIDEAARKADEQTGVQEYLDTMNVILQEMQGGTE